jgi:DNA mismatch endonuclease, patch repair protein
MADNLTWEQRQRCMSAVKNRNTKLEVLFKKALWAAGFRYRLKSRLPGRPDLVFPKQKIAVFIDGCFWHGCPKHGTMPRTNTAFWKAKIGRNKKRDTVVKQELTRLKWKTFRLWQHDLKGSPEKCVKKLEKFLKKR